MFVKSVIIEKLSWDGTINSIVIEKDPAIGDLRIAFPTEYTDSRESPFHFGNSKYEQKFIDQNIKANSKTLSSDQFKCDKDTYTFKRRWDNIPTEWNKLTYYAIYLPENAEIKTLSIKDERYYPEQYKRTVIKDPLSPRFIIYVKCSSTHGIFNFQLECKFIRNDVNFDTITYIDDYQTDFNSDPYEWQRNITIEDLNKLNKILEPSSRINLDTTITRSAKKKSIIKPSLTLIGVLIALSTLLFGDDIYSRYLKKTKINTPPQVDYSNITNNGILQVLYNDTLPYLQNVTIIDNGLYIKHSYSHFVMGGINIDSIKFNVRNKLGEKMNIIKSIGENKSFEVNIQEEPYLEFEYKGLYYSLEILGEVAFSATLKRIKEPTLELISYNVI